MTTACARRTAARTAREALACGGLRNRDEAADRSGTLLGPPAGPTPAQRVDGAGKAGAGTRPGLGGAAGADVAPGAPRAPGGTESPGRRGREGHQGRGREPRQEFSSLCQEQRETWKCFPKGGFGKGGFGKGGSGKGVQERGRHRQPGRAAPGLGAGAWRVPAGQVPRPAGRPARSLGSAAGAVMLRPPLCSGAGGS